METMALRTNEVETQTRTEDPLKRLLARPARISETIPRTGKFYEFTRDLGVIDLNKDRLKKFPEFLVKEKGTDMGLYVHGIRLVGEVRTNQEFRSETDGEISVQLSPDGEYSPISEARLAPIGVIRLLMLLDCGCI